MRNQDGLHFLDFCVANKLAITNTFFHKNKSRLITFSSGGNHAQTDFILVTRAQLKNIKDTKVISSKEYITQHKLLVCDLVVSAKPVKPIRIPPRKKIWKLKDTAVQKELEQAVPMKCQQIMQKWIVLRNISKIDFLKLQMRYVDGHKVGVHITKKPGGGKMRRTMQ